MLQDYHFSKNSLQLQIYLSHKSLCLLNTPLAFSRSCWNSWKKRGGCCQLVLHWLTYMVPPTWNPGNAHCKSDPIPQLLVHFPQEDFSELCNECKLTCQILFSYLYMGCFNVYMCNFLTILMEQFQCYEWLKKVSFHASSNIFKYVEVIIVLIPVISFFLHQFYQ